MMSEETAITTPSSVRMERILLAHKDCSASLTASPKSMVLLSVAGYDCETWLPVLSATYAKRCGREGFVDCQPIYSSVRNSRPCHERRATLMAAFCSRNTAAAGGGRSFSDTQRAADRFLSREEGEE